MQDELQKTTEATRMFMTHHISHEKSEALRKTLEENYLEAETFKNMQHKFDNIPKNETDYGVTLDGELVVASNDDAQSTIQSLLAETHKLFLRKTLQPARLVEELKKAHATEMLLGPDILHKEQHQQNMEFTLNTSPFIQNLQSCVSSFSGILQMWHPNNNSIKRYKTLSTRSLSMIIHSSPGMVPCPGTDLCKWCDHILGSQYKCKQRSQGNA
jgi:hypothetical protein